MYTVIWNPRFTLNGDNNGNPTSRTTFFDFRSKIIDRASQHTDEYWIVRPHPRAFAEYLSRGVLTRDELNQYISSEAMPDNGILDVMYTASSWDEAMSLLEKLKNERPSPQNFRPTAKAGSSSRNFSSMTTQTEGKDREPALMLR